MDRIRVPDVKTSYAMRTAKFTKRILRVSGVVRLRRRDKFDNFHTIKKTSPRKRIFPYRVIVHEFSPFDNRLYGFRHIVYLCGSQRVIMRPFLPVCRPRLIGKTRVFVKSTGGVEPESGDTSVQPKFHYSL